MLRIIKALAVDLLLLDARIDGLSGEIEELEKRDAGCERLTSIPGIGPIISSAIVAALGTGDAFAKEAAASQRVGNRARQHRPC
jgi:transposase